MGVFSAFTGQFLTFVSAGIAAIEHEFAHALVARRYGFTLDKIVLMPYGAAISVDISGISKKQEIAVCAAGPAANLATAIFFIALWWLYPETYPFTEAAAQVSFSLFLVNLLPAYPLDGGRILNVFLRPLGEKRAKTVRTALSLLIAAGVLAYFVYTCFSQPAPNALFFAGFVALGAAGGGKYNRLKFSRTKNFSRGLEETRVAIASDAAIADCLRFLREDRYLVLVLYEGEEFLGEISERDLFDALGSGDYSVRLRELLPQF